jgi:hypothetical protein
MIFKNREEWVRFGLSVLGAFIGVLILVVLLLTIFGQDTSHEDLETRLINIEFESRFQSCVIRIPPFERVEAEFARCAQESLVE